MSLNDYTGQKKYEFVALQLEKQIHQHDPPLHMLPPEVELARDFGVSVSTIRKALRLLVDQGLVDRRQGKGTFVLTPEGRGGASNRKAKKSVLLVVFTEEPFVQEEVAEIQKELFRNGLSTSLCHTSSSSPDEWLSEMQHILRTHDHDTHGVVCGPLYGRYDRIADAFKDLPWPVVFFKPSEAVPANYVGVDMAAGAYQAALHLYHLGCIRIRYFGLSKSESPRDKLAGFASFAAEFMPGQPLEELVIPTVSTVAGAYHVACEQFSAGYVPDGILAHSDLGAIGIMMAAEKHGVRIPADLALAGFDDIAHASDTVPPLTTVTQPKKQIAQELVRILKEAISNPSSNIRYQVVLQSHVTIRESTVGFRGNAVAGREVPVSQESAG